MPAKTGNLLKSEEDRKICLQVCKAGRLKQEDTTDRGNVLRAIGAKRPEAYQNHEKGSTVDNHNTIPKLFLLLQQPFSCTHQLSPSSPIALLTPSKAKLIRLSRWQKAPLRG